MIFKKKLLLSVIFLIIIFQGFLYINNNQKTSFRYFKWTIKEVSIGKLISISFFSGLFVSTLLNTTIKGYKKNRFENYEDNYEENYEDNYEPLTNNEDLISNIEMPPQRDIRDAQPTISVNYRIVKNTEENNLKRDENYSNNIDNKDDWNNVENDW